ncbi:MAG: hypothetical protein C4335_04015 [Armatimonadota bacterium]
MPHVDIRSFEQILRDYFPDSAIVSYAERRRQFHECYTEAVRRWQMDAVPKALKRFRREHPQFPWDEETLWGEYWDTIKGQLNWATEDLLDEQGYIENAATEFSPKEREAIWAAIAT